MYSYLLIGQTGPNSIEQCTCFFVRRNGRLFLVTALHVFEGWDGIRGILHEPYTEEFFIRLPHAGAGISELVAVDTSAHRRGVTRHRFYERADIVIVEIRLPDHFVVNSIETILFNGLDVNQQITSLTATGFPVDHNLNDADTYVYLLTAQTVTLQPLGNITIPVRWQPPIDRIDPIIITK